jgi:hypothetical protein
MFTGNNTTHTTAYKPKIQNMSTQHTRNQYFLCFNTGLQTVFYRSKQFLKVPQEFCNI